MKLDQQTIIWIEEVTGNMAHGVIQLVVCDKQITKIITEDRRIHVRKTIDKKDANVLDSA